MSVNVGGLAVQIYQVGVFVWSTKTNIVSRCLSGCIRTLWCLDDNGTLVDSVVNMSLLVDCLTCR
ncbi:hypothetical protein AO375_0920 [Moraxella catarrhalis]|nr:hypothetical protein AO375_0920 [Moraxella catarrhalis]